MARARTTIALLLPWMALVGCLPENTSVPQSPLLRWFERKAGTIAYMASDGNIFTIDQAGGKKTALTSDAVLPQTSGPTKYYQGPVWSPDGRMVAFTVTQGTTDRFESAGILVSRPDGTGVAEIFSSPERTIRNLGWSPEGKSIAFAAVSLSGASTLLELVPAAGGAARVLDAGSAILWSWSRDALKLLVHAGSATGEQTATRLSFLHIDAEIVEESLPMRPGTFRTPSWSPDGDRALIGAEKNGKTVLVIVDSKGTEIGPVAVVEGLVLFSWSPDGRKIAYLTEWTQEEKSGSRLTLVDARPGPAGGDPVEKGRWIDEEAIAGFFWSPNNASIAYFVPSVVGSGQEDQTLYLTLKVLDVGRNSSRTIRTFSPTLLYMSVVQDFDLFGQQARIWSPDSKNILYCSIESDGPSIMVTGATGAIEPRKIASGLAAAWSQ